MGSYPEAVEAGVAVEELHVLGGQRAQDLLDGEQLVDLALPREQRLAVAQLPQDAAHRSHVHRLPVGGAAQQGGT